MNRTPHRLLIVSAVSALLLGLTACSSPSSTSATPSVDSSGDAISPVEAYLAPAENDWRNATRAHFAANQDKIARCMKAAGFDYTPSTLPPAPAPIDKNTQEWVAKHGYGLSARDQAEAERRSIILDTPYGIEAPAQTAYLSHLSKNERDAYDAALLGDVSTQSIDEQGGCMVGQPIDPRFTPAATKLARDSFGYQGRAASDPRTTKAQDDWAACMVKAGHDGLSTPGDAYQKISELYQPAGDGRSKKDATPPPLDDAQRTKARKAELAMALDDFDCKTTTKYLERTNGVLFALESAWVSRHKAELDDVIAGYREASK